MLTLSYVNEHQKPRGGGPIFFPGFFKTGGGLLKKNSEKNPDTFLINFSLENGLEIVLANQRGPRTRLSF